MSDELLVTPDQVVASWPKFAAMPALEQAALIADASEAVLDYCNRDTFLATSVTEAIDGKGLPRIWLSTRPVITVSAVSVNGIALDNTAGDAWLVTPKTGLLIRGNFSGSGRGDIRFGWRWPSGTQNIVVQYWGGYAAVPPLVVRATKFAAQWLYQQGQKGGTGIYASESIADYAYTLNPKGLTGVLPDHIRALLYHFVQDDGPA